MLVLGLDPGSRHTGWGVVECRGAALRALGWGRWSPPTAAPLEQRLAAIAAGLEAEIARHAPQVAAVERVFHGMNTRSLIVLAEARGALLVTLARCGVPIVEMPPASIKSAVTGHGAADKVQVARMVRLQLALGDARLPPDASDALAVAIACGASARAALPARP